MIKFYFRYVLYTFVLIGFNSAAADSYTDYFRALKVDNAGAVQELLERGFDPNAPDEQGQVGLFLALRDGSPKTAAVLLAHPGLKLDAVNANDETPLMMAALRGRLDWVTRLLDRGAAVSRPGWTPLHYAATGPDDGTIVKLLLQRQAQIDALSPNGSTPLMMAARYGTDAAAEALLARGASTQLRNQRGMNAADFAASAGRQALAVRLAPK